MKRNLTLVSAILAAFALSWDAAASVTITAATGGTGISADKAANAPAAQWISLGQIVITEPGSTGRDDFSAGTNLTLILKAPTGFEFNTAITPSFAVAAGGDISSPSIVMDNSNTLTLTFTVNNITNNDTLTIGATTNLQVRAVSGTLLTNGVIYRPSGTNGGNAVVSGLAASSSGNGSGGDSFGSLSVVAGNATKLAFTRDPASAVVGANFGTQPIIKTQDQFGNNTTSGLAATVSVVTALTAGTGPFTGTRTNNIGTAGGNGTITHNNLRIDSVGNDKQLTATTTNLSSGLSGVFTVGKGSQTITFTAIANHTYGDVFTLSPTASSGLPVTLSVDSGPATISSNSVTVTGVGSVTIRASQSGDTNWNAAADVTRSFTASKATPTITWTNPAPISYGTPLSATQLNATASIPGTFVYSPAAGTILTVGNNKPLSVTFTPADTTNYNNATEGVTINVIKANQTITFGPLADKVVTDPPFPLSATASSGLTVTFSLVSGPATLSSSNVTLTGISGVVTVRAVQAGNTSYNPATNIQSFNVTKVVALITWLNPSDIVYGTPLGISQLNATSSVPGTFNYNPTFGNVMNSGSNQTLSVSFTPSNTNTYTNASANVLINVLPATPAVIWTNPPNITYGTPLSTNQLNATASVSGTFVYSPAVGTLLEVGTQSLSVTFTPDNTNYSVATSSVSITVAKATPSLTWTSPAEIIYGTALGTNQLNAVAPVPGTFTYTPDFGAVLSAGTNQVLLVNFIPDDTTNYDATSASTSITVLKATPILTWTTPANIVYGTALGTNELNATASVPGTLVYLPVAGTILSAGTNQLLSVTLFPDDSTNYDNGTASVTIDVLKANQTISFGPLSDQPSTNSSFDINATSSSGLTVQFSIVSGPATISGNTITLTGSTGTVTVRASQSGDSDFNAAADVDQAFNVTSSTSTIAWSNPADISYGTPLSTNELNATCNVPGTFAYTPDVGTILSAGTNQMLSVTFTPSDTNAYSPATATVFINILKATPSITWSNPASIVYGTALRATQLNATSSIPGTLTFTPPVGTILTAGTNTLSVSLAPTDSSNYFNANANVEIVVMKATPTITWTNPASIVYGTTLGTNELNATSPVLGTFTYTPAAGTALNAGNGQTLSVAFAPADTTNYNEANTTVVIDVLKATPSITWTNPASIVYGTALSATQLNASSSVIGAFTYSRTAGTVVNAGTNTLSVAFTPNDLTNYNTASASISLEVTKASLTVTADSFTRFVGTTNPVFTGTLNGIVNSDSITSDYNCAATSLSLPGAYLIVPFLNDPANRLGNYDVFITNGTLTVLDLPSLSIIGGPNYTVQVIGPTNQTYDIQATGDLNTIWTAIGTTALGDSGLQELQDNAPTNAVRFYRIQVQ